LAPLVEAKKLSKLYLLRGGLRETLTRKKHQIRAVDDVSFTIQAGEVLGLVGESGCGKSTTGRLLTRLEEPTTGSIEYEGIEITSLAKSELKAFRQKAQMIFQDPYESLDPRYTVGNAVSEPLVTMRIGATKHERMRMVVETLEQMELRPASHFMDRYPHELSGGQRQRVVIARAMILHPRFVVADEAVSMLDVSVRSGILDLMLKMREMLDVAFLFITHDLAVARYMSDRIAVMYLGRIVEIGPTERIVHAPYHPYAELLLSAVPDPDPASQRRRVVPAVEMPSETQTITGCPFHPRCRYATDLCRQTEPSLTQVEKEHYVSCHHPLG
jgi:peptide/nickel transport system ATP-binding protein